MARWLGQGVDPVPELTASVVALFAACISLGVGLGRNRRGFASHLKSLHPLISAVGWILLARGALGFILRLGWTVGLSWFLLWFGVAMLSATVGFRIREPSARWLGGTTVLCGFLIVLGPIVAHQG
ncbi:MAG: hypothetical protein MPN21_12405 [Thermoanaerobaculia bacterium]|nr:hypothetical protein [Thermoanaerobaculia bacterium]